MIDSKYGFVKFFVKFFVIWSIVFAIVSVSLLCLAKNHRRECVMCGYCIDEGQTCTWTDIGRICDECYFEDEQ